MTGAVFAPVLAGLKGFTCIAPDLPGHGGSLGYPPSVSGGVALLADLIAREQVEGAVLVGWSLGALIGWEYLARHGSGKIAGMVSLDMSPRPLNGPDWALGLRGQSAEDARAKTAWFRTGWPRAAGAIARTMFATHAGAPSLSVAEAERRIAAQPAATMAAYWASLIECDLRDALARLPVPHLAIHGTESRVYPAGAAQWLAAQIPDSQALLLPGAGHAPILEAPEACLTAITQFARRIQPQ